MDCSKCLNESICKFTDDALGIKQKVETLRQEMRAGIPFYIEARCNRYQSNQINKADLNTFYQQLNSAKRRFANG